MTAPIRRAVVLGSGVMGGAIAAHLANAGIRSLLLDIVPHDAASHEPTDRAARNRLADASLAALAKSRPAALFSPARARLIETGNFADDMPRVAEADWVIEVVREDLAIKHELLAAAASYLRDDAVLSSNTSGLSLETMAEALPAEVRTRFLGTHFFNPPRYMRLLELIPTRQTDPAVLATLESFFRGRLGKGVVFAKDTPNFIANRVGVHAMMVTLHVMDREGLTVEEIDALTGPPIGRPKTATFRLADLVGLDTLALVARNIHENAPQDECQEQFEPPAFLARMIERGLLGRKSGAGFYRRAGGGRGKSEVLDTRSLEYREPREPDWIDLGALRRIADPAERVRRLVAGEDRAARVAWSLLAPTLAYAAMRLGEIADSAETIDRALRLGFNWELGPFEIWDALGFLATAERLRSDGLALAPWVEALAASGAGSIYTEEGSERTSPTGQANERSTVSGDPSALTLEPLRRAGCDVRHNGSASLVDLGDGVLCLEFRTKMNAIDTGVVEMMVAAADEAERTACALVVANDAGNFSAGADLKRLAVMMEEGDWDGIERLVRSFQAACDRLESCAVPVVAAPHGLALGGGCEVVLAANAIRAAAESYIGLVEIGAGLIPAGGGCMRLYRRNVERLTDGDDVYPALLRSFETIGKALVSSSAEEARDLGFLRPGDGWSMNREHLLHDAKRCALALAAQGWSPAPPAPLRVLGRAGRAAIAAAIVNMRQAGYISDYDARIGGELAGVLCGGDVAGPVDVAPAHLLDLEVEAFLRLAGEVKTRERIVALLETGKPLRN